MSARVGNQPAAERRAPSPALRWRDLLAAPEAWLIAAALAVYAVPGLARALQYERALGLIGNGLRLASCHLAHFSGEHLLWDAAALAAIGFGLRSQSRARRALVLAVAALVVPRAVHALAPGLDTYRGLSGLVSAAFGLGLAAKLRASVRARAAGPACLWGLLLAGFAAKLAFELFAGEAVFVASAEADFVPVPLAHLVGAAVGGAGGAAPPPPPPPPPQGPSERGARV
ncbi:MAG: rhomboid family intramembrane serine protease, partial [Planctomycetota bacterium]